MKNYIRGWNRDHGQIPLFDFKLSTMSITPTPTDWERDKVYLLQKTDQAGRITDFRIRGMVENLKVNGNYQYTVDLTSDDVLSLARHIIQKMSAKELADFIRQ